MGFSQGFFLPDSQIFLINTHYLCVIYLDYIKTCQKRVRDKTKMIFKKTEKSK